MKRNKPRSQAIISADERREDILKYLYDRYKKSRSVKKQGASIREIKSALKPKGYTEQEIAGDISFPVDRGWIKEEKSKTKFFIKGRLAEGEKISYRIGDVGISHFEGLSKFFSLNKYSGINVTNIQGITVIGNSNVVKNEYVNLFNELEKLGEIVRGNSKLSDIEKIDIQSDLETIKNQIGKSEPNKEIVKTCWKNIKSKLMKIPEIADKLTSIISLIKMITG